MCIAKNKKKSVVVMNAVEALRQLGDASTYCVLTKKSHTHFQTTTVSSPGFRM